LAQARVPFVRCELEPHTPLGDAMLADEPVQPFGQPERRIFQTHRFDRVLRDRHTKDRPCHLDLLVVADKARDPLARRALEGAVEIDEVDGAGALGAVRHAGVKTRCHERQMRVAVGRLHAFLLGRQLGAKVEIIVLVAGVRGKYRLKEVQIRLQAGAARRKARGKALRQVAGRRMWRDVQAAREPVEGVAVRGGCHRADINDVDPRARANVQCGFERRHDGPNGTTAGSPDKVPTG
jgi:hypothetical protein